jgi:hypothetical protein
MCKVAGLTFRFYDYDAQVIRQHTLYENISFYARKLCNMDVLERISKNSVRHGLVYELSAEYFANCSKESISIAGLGSSRNSRPSIVGRCARLRPRRLLIS